MFRGIRKRITYANVSMTLALVFAMAGGAFAANRIVITSTKQISKGVLKKLEGKRGPAGLTGAVGPAGASGKGGAPGAPGVPGEKGESGVNGVSIVSKELLKGDTNCKEGGSEFTAAQDKKSYACNGSPWSAGGTLPKGSTEKGDWSFGQANAPSLQFAAFSFTIPLATEPIAVYVKSGESTPTHCAGSVSNPGADTGYLCVFAKEEGSIMTGPGFGPGHPKVCSAAIADGTCLLDPSEPESADPGGFNVVAFVEEAGFAYGTWAVTG